MIDTTASTIAANGGSSTFANFDPTGSSAGTPATTSTNQSNTQPIIPTSTITDTKPLKIPPAPNNGQTPFSSIMSNTQAMTDSQKKVQDDASKAVNNAQSNYNATGSSLATLINQYSGKGADQATMEKEAGTPGLLTARNDLNNQMLTQQATYNDQYDKIFSNPNITSEQAAQQISDLQQQHGYDLTRTGILASIADNNYTNAQNLINHQIDLKYSTIKDTIGFGFQFLQNNKDILSEATKNQLTANLQVQQQQYDQGTFFAKLNGTSSMQMIQDATANGAPKDVIDKMTQLASSGASAGEVGSAGGQYLLKGNYSMQFNPATNQMETYNQNTGKFQSGASGSSTSPTYDMSDPVSVGSSYSPNGTKYDFTGTSTGAKAYASDPNYGMKVQQATSTINAAVGNINSPETMQMAISQFSPNSKLSGKDVYQAALNAGIDPNVFAGQLMNESLLGTSPVAVNNNNFGGVKYTGSADQKKLGMTQGTKAAPEADGSDGGYYAKFQTPQAGLAYQARIDTHYATKPSPLTTGQTQTTQQKLDALSQIKTKMPSYMATAFGTLDQSGDGYIDSSLLSSPTGAPNNFAENQAKAYITQMAKVGVNIQYLNHDDVLTVRDANEILKNTNNVAAAWAKVGPQSIGSRAENQITDPLDTNLATPHGQDLIAYNAMLPTSINAINSIIGSHRVTGMTKELTDESLPQTSHPNIGGGIAGGITGALTGGAAGFLIGGLGAIPGAIYGVIAGAGLGASTGGDTIDSGNRKLDNLREAANATVTKIMQNSKGAPLSSDLKNTPAAQGVTANSTVYFKGNSTYPAGNYAVDAQGNMTPQ